ncbi:uncharacterized protein [Mytilus edulis]|uniref:uncharacterized protein n=1 Tax=Mytilus edulis TaxID=6550 RepID=UPI0039F00423
MVVLWKPGFNGGTPQWFTVIWKDMKTNTSIVKSSIPDSDNGQYVKVTTSSLIDGTTYLIYVEASNKYGRVRATMYDNCTTKSAEFFQSGNFIAVGVGAGIGTSLMILILAAIVVFIFKRLRRRDETEGNAIYESTQSGSRELPANEDHLYNDLQQFQGDNNKQHIDQATYANQSF